MRYVIIATAANGSAQHFSGDGFKANLLQAARFRTEKDAQRRSENSVHCRRMAESGAKLSIIKIGETEGVNDLMPQFCADEMVRLAEAAKRRS